MIQRTVLDPELISMRARIRGGRAAMAPMRMETLARRLTAASDEEVGEGEGDSRRVALKLITRPGARQHVEEWVRSVGGEIVSSGPSVLVVHLDVEVVADLDKVGGIQRAEASRRLRFAISDARGAVTGADLAIEKHKLSGRGRHRQWR